MRFSEYPFLRYLFFILLGLISGKNMLEGWGLWIQGSIVVIWLTYLITLLQKRAPIGILPSLSYLLLVLFGLYLAQEEQHPTVSNFISNPSDSSFYLAKALEYDLEKPNSHENLLEVLAIKEGSKWIEKKGKVLIYHQLSAPLEPGNLLLIKGFPERIMGPRNPSEFDYQEFMARKGIYFRQFINEKAARKVENTTKERFIGKELRKSIIDRIERDIPDPAAQQVAQALLLGEKKTLDRATRDSYAQAGVMHILAVSGLHVGIIYGLFFFLGNRLKLKGRTKKIYFLVVILIIWSYAFLTGFSPSVIRAATMFSLITMGQLRDRKTSIVNILAFSATLMICFDPKVIYEVGFQLSYLAVFGIVLLQPLILKLWLPRYRILEYFWQILAVSIAAQLATFPLTVYYFHSFPTYFMLGNLVILPLAFLIMQVGVPWILLGMIPWLGSLLGKLLNLLIGIQNSLIFFINQLPGGHLDRLSISWEMMLLIWTGLLLWAGWDIYSRKTMIRIGALCFFLWFGIDLVKTLTASKGKELIVYSKKGAVLIDLYDGETYYAYNADYSPEDISYSVDPNRISRGVDLVPNDLLALKDTSGEVFFPSLGLRLDPQKRQIKLAKDRPERISIWENDNWISIPSPDSVALEGKAIRILF